MICTANYEARKYGVRAAMPGFIALKLCPHLKFVETNFPKYEAAAASARAVFARFDPNFSSRGLDEASLCVTEYCCTSGLTPAQVHMTTCFIDTFSYF
jgi:DNA polymerase kappa